MYKLSLLNTYFQHFQKILSCQKFVKLIGDRGIGIFFSWWFICAKKRFVILATFHNTEMSKKLELCDLPQELLYDILVRIPDQNWLAFGLTDVNQPPSLTCKRWKALISTKNFWRRYHSYWQSKVPQKLFQSEQPWQYFASIRYTFAI